MEPPQCARFPGKSHLAAAPQDRGALLCLGTSPVLFGHEVEIAHDHGSLLSSSGLFMRVLGVEAAEL